FQAGISPTDHDQMLRQIIELESVNMRERLGRLQVGNIWNGRVGSDIEENLVGYQLARAAVVQIHLKGFWRYETAAAHDQFGAARAVNLQVLRNLALYHRALALTNNHHVDGDGTGHSTVLPAVYLTAPRAGPRLATKQSEYLLFQRLHVCQVRFWHLADIPEHSTNVRFWG